VARVHICVLLQAVINAKYGYIQFAGNAFVIFCYFCHVITSAHPYVCSWTGLCKVFEQVLRTLYD